MSRGLALLSDAFGARLGLLSVAQQAELRTLLEKLNDDLAAPARQSESMEERTRSRSDFYCWYLRLNLHCAQLLTAGRRRH